MFAVGLVLAAGLFAFGVGTAARQRPTLRRLHDERFLPSDERAYLRGQVRRRFLTSAIVASIGIMIGWSYLSGMEGRATEIAERSRKAAENAPEHEAGRPADVQPPSDEEKRRIAAEKAFVSLYGYFWLGILALVFLAVSCAIFDFWATRRYWMAQYRIIKDDHEAKLRRDLAVYRQAKDNDRMTGLDKKMPDDQTDEEPLAG